MAYAVGMTKDFKGLLAILSVIIQPKHLQILGYDRLECALLLYQM